MTFLKRKWHIYSFIDKETEAQEIKYQTLDLGLAWFVSKTVSSATLHNTQDLWDLTSSI